MTKKNLHPSGKRIRFPNLEQDRRGDLTGDMRQLDFIDSTIERQLVRMQIDMKILYSKINALQDRMTILNMAIGNRAKQRDEKPKEITMDMFAS